jgi:putative FmdB family regulatory protein
VPIYEYRCLDCHKRSSVLLLSRTASSPSCAHCRSPRLERLLSRFSSPKCENTGSLTDDPLAGVDEQDPAAMERLMKQMGGDDFVDDETQGIDQSEESMTDLDGSDV